MKYYDIVIIGGGISGLNIAYQLSKRRDNRRVLLLESLDHLGGRIYTYTSRTWGDASLEAGAGRFHKGHERLFNLIKDVDLEENIQSIGKPNIKHVSHGSEVTKNVNKIVKLIMKRAKNVPIEILREQSIISFVRRRAIISEEELSQLVGYYGYYSELEVMNAYDAIELMKNGTNPENEFFVMHGGLSQIIRKMERVCSTAGVVRIMKNKNVLNVWRRASTMGETPPSSARSSSSGSSKAAASQRSGEIMIKCQDGTEYCCEKCIFAVPKPSLEKFSIVRDGSRAFQRAIQSVVCAPLCRIYSYYDNSRNKWIREHIQQKFGGAKLTMNSMLRFLIPVDENIIMTSYTDNVFAEWWKEKYDNGGIVSINHEITWQLREAFRSKSIPVANKTRVFYWDCGVGYWGVGANSKEAAEIVLNAGGAGDVFICGENYSEKYQQWIEGALETSDSVLSKILV